MNTGIYQNGAGMSANEIDYTEFNKDIITEFRANKGVVSGVFTGTTA